LSALALLRGFNGSNKTWPEGENTVATLCGSTAVPRPPKVCLAAPPKALPGKGIFDVRAGRRPSSGVVDTAAHLGCIVNTTKITTPNARWAGSLNTNMHYNL